MLDIKAIRENTEEIERRLQTRDPNVSLQEVVDLDEQRRNIIG